MKKQIEMKLDQALNLNQYEEEAIRKNNPNSEASTLSINYKAEKIDKFLQLLVKMEGRITIFHVFYRSTTDNIYWGKIVAIQENLVNISITSEPLVKTDGMPFIISSIRSNENIPLDGFISDKAFIDAKTDILAIHEIEADEIGSFKNINLTFTKIKNTEKANCSKDIGTINSILNQVASVSNTDPWNCQLHNDDLIIDGSINLLYIFTLNSNIDSMKVFKDYYNLKYVLNALFRYEDKTIPVISGTEILDVYLQYMPGDNKTRVSFIKDKVITVADSSVIQLEKREFAPKEEQPGVLTSGKIEILTQPINYLAQEMPIILSIAKRKDSSAVFPSVNTNNASPEILNYHPSFPKNSILSRIGPSRVTSGIQPPYRIMPIGPAYKHSILSKDDRIKKIKNMMKKEPYRQDLYCISDNVLINTPLKLFNPSSYNELTNSISSYIKEETFAYRLTNYSDIKAFCYYTLDRLAEIESSNEILPGLTIAKKDSSFLMVYRENGVLKNTLDIRAINICPTNTTNLSTKLTINPFDYLFNSPENANQKYIIDIMISTIYSLISFINNNTMNEDQLLQIILKKTKENDVPFFFCLKSDKSVFNLGSFYWLIKEGI